MQPIKIPHLSASQLRSYAGCSLKWYLSRRNAPAFVSACLVFGTGIHAAVEQFYQGRLEGRTVTQAAMLEAFDQAWEEETTPVRFGAKDSRERLRETACAMLEVFAASATGGTVLAVEEPFLCSLAPGLPPMKGVIDLVERVEDEDGPALCLVDWKTAARKPSASDSPDPDQLHLYALAARQTGLLEQFNLPLRLEYRVLTKTKTPEVITVPVKVNASDTARLVEKARQIHAGMTNGICFPHRGWQCAGCGYQALCRQWPDLPAA